MKDEQEVFVSRHGHRTKIENADLNGLNIDEQPVAPTTDALPVKHVTEPIKEFRAPSPPRSGKKIAIIAAVLLSILLLPFAIFETVAWQYRQAGATLKGDVDRVAKQTALPLQKKDASVSSIGAPLGELRSSVNNACRGGMLDNIATIYPRSKSALDQCNATKTKANAIVAELAVLQNIQRYSEATDAILKPALAASNSPYAVLPDQVASWQTVTDKLRKLDAPNELKTFHSALTQVAGDIASQWSAINTANNAQDKAAFDEAQTKLASFYESLRELSPTLIGIQNNVQTKLSAATAAVR